MSKFRYPVLVHDKALATDSTAGTEYIDLPETGILSSLQILFRHMTAWVDNTTLPPVYAISKVEVLVDGSTVVKSLSGAQIRALMWYNGGPFGSTSVYAQNQGSNYLYHDFPLYFGRSINDTEYGLDLSKFSNPILKITYDEATTTHEGVTYNVCSDPTIVYNVMAKLMDEPPAKWQDKYVMSREINTWTMAQGAIKTTEIPRGDDLRGIMLRCGYKNKGYFDHWEHVKLDFNNGQWVPIDMDYENLLRLHLEAWPNPVNIGRYGYLQDGDDLNMEVYWVNGSGWSASAMNIYMLKIPIIYWPISTCSIRSNDGTTPTTPGAFTYTASGWGPMQTFYIPMKILLDGEEETIDTKPYGRIDLKTTSGSSASTSAIGHVIAEYDRPNRGS